MVTYQRRKQKEYQTNKQAKVAYERLSCWYRQLAEGPRPFLFFFLEILNVAFFVLTFQYCLRFVCMLFHRPLRNTFASWLRKEVWSRSGRTNLSRSIYGLLLIEQSSQKPKTGVKSFWSFCLSFVFSPLFVCQHCFLCQKHYSPLKWYKSTNKNCNYTRKTERNKWIRD